VLRFKESCWLPSGCFTTAFGTENGKYVQGRIVMVSRFRLAFVVVLTVFVLAITGCTGTGTTGNDNEDPTAIPVPPVPEKPTYTVKLGTIVDSLNFTGRVSPSVEKGLFFRTAGRIKQVMVERGDAVVSGTVLAELENDDLLRQLAQAELDLQTATLDLNTAKGGQDYAIARAKIALEISKLQLAKLAASGGNDTGVQMALINLQRAEAALKQAQARYDFRAKSPGAEASGEALALEQATLDYEAAQLSYNNATSSGDPQVYDLEIMRQQVALAELDLEHLQADVNPQLVQAVERNKLTVARLNAFIADTQIASSIPGNVTSVSATAGKNVDAYSVVFVVSDDSKLEIRAEPLSSQMQKLQEGMSCAIVLSQYPGKELTGTITQLPYPYGKGGGAADSSTSGTTTTAEQVDKSTHIDFSMGDLVLKPGDLVKVVVTLQEKADVLWLPPAAIRTFSGRKFVVVDDNGSQRRIDITTGIETEDRVEITDGLTEGQVVLGQ
jgi:multidrug efflux pump subunit AcrA (membrane-fusion protein)